MNIYLAFLTLAAALAVLFKAGDWFVSGAVGLSLRLHMPKMLVGIVIVGFSTTLPELFVSVQSAWRGFPEIALGNAIGSVIADDALALALAAVIVPMLVHRGTFLTAAPFLIAIDFLAFGLAADGTLSRWEGGLLVCMLLAYILFALRQAARGRIQVSEEVVQAQTEHTSWKPILLHFGAGLAGVLLCSHLIVESSLAIAHFYGISEFVIGLTIVAVGTSLPEIATVIAAARKRETEVAAGNIIGADILNVLWIAGMSAVVNPITVSQQIILFSFPAMIIVVLTMLLFLRTGWRMTRPEGLVLLGMYGVYIWLLASWFGTTLGGT